MPEISTLADLASGEGPIPGSELASPLWVLPWWKGRELPGVSYSTNLIHGGSALGT